MCMKPNADPPKDWIVKLTRRKDGRKYYYRHDGCTTARRESSMRLDKETAVQLATAIRTHHRDFTARAMRYESKAHEAKDERREVNRIIFNLDGRWYDLIRRGEKVVEYREIKPYWTARLRNALGGKLPKPNTVAVFPTNLVAVFRNGYGGRPSKFNSATPDIVRRVNYVDIGPCPYDGWDGDYFRIHFEKREEK